MARELPISDAEPLPAIDINNEIQVIAQEFDEPFYRSQNSDVDFDVMPPLEHFSEIGWQEGRNPASWFSVEAYLARHEDVRNAHLNPFFHYLRFGRAEGREIGEPTRPAPSRAEAEIGHASELELMRPEFDEEFYREKNPGVSFGATSPLEHFANVGWREGRDPAPWFSTQGYLAHHEDVRHANLNPFFHYLRFGREEGREIVRSRVAPPPPEPALQPSIAEAQKAPDVVPAAPTRTLDPHIRSQLTQMAYERALSENRYGGLTASRAPLRRYDSHELNLVASEFDEDFYAAEYPDVVASGLEGIVHYCQSGWREKRNPAPWFDTKYYLAANPDVAAAGINPFWHYLVAGMAEGRLARSDSSVKLRILQGLKPIEVRTDQYPTPAHTVLRPGELEACLRKALAGAEAVALAFSHDCYPTVTGGVQFFVADEQAKLNARKCAYVHFSPLRAGLYVKDTPPEATQTRIVVNGDIVGVASDAEVADVLRRLETDLPDERTFIVHSPLGHSVAGLVDIHAALRPAASYFWVHDSASICAGFHLMRNDIAYCGAPEMGSESCHICIYGPSRAVNQERMLRLFTQCDFIVLAPSELAKDNWARASRLPHRGLLVVEHCRLVTSRDASPGAPADIMGTQARPVRIAYIGYPIHLKGWSTFERILDASAKYVQYEFYHFASADSLRVRKNLKGVASEASPDDRSAMIRRLEEHDVDLVVVAAECAETFSFVTYEALAAGCDIITLERSGNVAATVRRMSRGRVFEHEDELVEFFSSGKAVAYARARAEVGVCRGSLIHDGTTAAVL